MILKHLNEILGRTQKEMKTLNEEFETMAKINKCNATDIRESIKQKSENFNTQNKVRNKHFKIIRNK